MAVVSRPERDPRIPIAPGTEHVRFSPTRETLLALSAKQRREVLLGDSYERDSCMQQEKDRL